MEESKNIHSPIVHSMKNDTISSAQTIVGSNEVPDDEALLLAKMQSVSLKKRQISAMSILSVLFLIVGVFIFLIPNNFFTKKDTGITVVKYKNQNFLGVDSSYSIKLPNQDQIDNFKNKSFSGESGISEIIIKDVNDSVVPFVNLVPFLTERFITNLTPIITGDYLYGFFTDTNLKSSPYFIFSVSERHVADEKILESERTMYNDLSNILMLPKVDANEFLQFESSSSVRVPTRILQDRSGQVLLVYGFPMDSIVLVTTSVESYNAIRNRMLIGY
jgi:hypothetical protein